MSVGQKTGQFDATGQRMADEMKGYDRDQKKWKLRTKDLTISMSLVQLSDWSGVELTEARQSAPYWSKYKRAMLDRVAALRVAATPIGMGYGGNGFSISVPNFAGESSEELTKRNWKPVFKPVEPTKDLKYEVAEYINKKGGNYKNHLQLFLDCVGTMEVASFNLDQYRKWLSWVESNHTGSEQTSKNRIKSVKTFLKNLEQLHNLDFRFLRSSDLHLIKIENTEKRNLADEYWTLDEIKLAIKEATGLARFSLLMGLNAGCYDSDIAGDYFTTDKIKDGYYHSGRAKNLRRGTQKGGTGVWRLWHETIASVVPNANKRTMRDHFRQLRVRLGITKTQEGLRKTIANEIQHRFGEETSRLYRAEFTNDTHHTSYVDIKDERRFVRLSEALDHIGNWLGLS